MAKQRVEGRTDDLTDVDRAILDELESAYGEGSVLGADLAALVGVEGKAIGSRLSGLVRRGFVMGHMVEGGYTGWTLTLSAMNTRPWRQ